MQDDHLGSLIPVRMCGVMRKDAQDKFKKRGQGTSWPVESHVYCQGKGQTHIYGFGEGELSACGTYGGDIQEQVQGRFEAQERSGWNCLELLFGSIKINWKVTGR